MSMSKRGKRKSLHKPVSFLENKNGEIEQQIDRQEQYFSSNCLLIYGKKEGTKLLMN